MIRYEGWYKAASGTKKLRYSVWLHAFAGLPYVRIYDKLIWTENLTLYVSIDTASGVLSTKSLFADRNGVSSVVAHGWSSGDAVRWTYSHSDIDAKGANQYYDNTMAKGRALVVLPKVAGPPLRREATYYVRVVNEAALTLHRTPADAQSGANPIKFLDRGIYASNGVTYGGRHYLQAQNPVLAEWGVRLNLAAPATHASVDAAGAASPHTYDLAETLNVTAEQSAHGTASIVAGNGSAIEAGKLAGWAEARFAGGAGLAVAVKGLGEQCPKVLQVDGTSVTVKLWGGKPMSLAEEDRVLAAYDESGYPKEWLAFSGEANPVGISKTHEIWVWPAGHVANDRLINDLVQRPVACCADPAYACATNYVLGVRPTSRTPEEYGYVETALENMLRYLTTRDSKQGDHDEWNFGDLRLFRNGPFRTWDNGGYNCGDLFWWQFYRTGKRFFLEEGINTARHTMDVDTIAHSQSVSGGYDTYLRIAGRTHYYATLQWAGPAPRGDGFNDHPWYLLLCWLMTGYEVARTVLETKCDERKIAGYGDPGDLANYPLASVTREQYGAIMPKFVYHEFTGDAHFYAAGRMLLQLAMNAQAASSETNARGTRLFPNNNFLGFFYEAFLSCYRYAGEAQVLASLGQTVDDFAASPTHQYDCADLGLHLAATQSARAGAEQPGDVCRRLQADRRCAVSRLSDRQDTAPVPHDSVFGIPGRLRHDRGHSGALVFARCDSVARRLGRCRLSDDLVAGQHAALCFADDSRLPVGLAIDVVGPKAGRGGRQCPAHLQGRESHKSRSAGPRSGRHPRSSRPRAHDSAHLRRKLSSQDHVRRAIACWCTQSFQRPAGALQHDRQAAQSARYRHDLFCSHGDRRRAVSFDSFQLCRGHKRRKSAAPLGRQWSDLAHGCQNAE